MGGSCNANEALSLCNSELFAGSSSGRTRVLVVLMAGRSSVSLSYAATALKTVRVKVIAVGMGRSVSSLQLSSMAYSTYYKGYIRSFSALAGITTDVSTLISKISKGKSNNNYFANLYLGFDLKIHFELKLASIDCNRIQFS